MADTQFQSDNPAPSPKGAAHDAIAHEVEQTMPEGPSPRGGSTVSTTRALVAFGAIALIGMIVFLFLRGGWVAGLVGIAVLFLYGFLASTPWMAGVFRARDRREVETIVHHELHENPSAEPLRPA
jgi:hypothetical protein